MGRTVGANNDGIVEDWEEWEKKLVSTYVPCPSGQAGIIPIFQCSGLTTHYPEEPYNI